MPKCPRQPKKTDIGKRGGWLEPRKPSTSMLTLPERHMFVTEGTKTEPAYIQGLVEELAQKLGNGVKKQITIWPEGTNTLFLLKRAEDHLHNQKYEYQHIWIMYDLDDFPHDYFDNVVARCDALNKRNSENGSGPKYHAIWSNQCFELWVLLHFGPMDSAIDRNDYYEKISHHLSSQGICNKYEKNNKEMFSYIRPHLKAAIKNAERLEKKFTGISPSRADPCTMVHHLFEDQYFGQYIL